MPRIADGIIGLGPDALSSYSNSRMYSQILLSTFSTARTFWCITHRFKERKVIKTAITNIVEQNADLSNVFGVKFQPVPTGYYSSMNGLIALGGLPDPSWYDGKMNWIPRINTTRAAVCYIDAIFHTMNISHRSTQVFCVFAGLLGCCCWQR